MMDSGASQHFTPYIGDFTTYEKLKNVGAVQTADKNGRLSIVGIGSIFVTHKVPTNEKDKLVKKDFATFPSLPYP
jgi:hypothetical protein